MKRRFLPLSLFLIFTMLGGFVMSTSGILKNKKYVPRTYPKDALSKGNKPSAEYLKLLRNNQETGIISSSDLLTVQKQLAAMKSSRSQDIEWKELGPDNFGGRTRAIIFDNKDAEAKTAFAGSVTGGIWKTTDLGTTWEKINQEGSNLKVSCMIQTDNGDIYVGTGESFAAETMSGLEDMGFNGGFVGSGVYKSTDGNNFSLIASTTPDFNDDNGNWAFVNELAFGSGKLFAATNTGLKYSSDGGANWAIAKDADGNELSENSTDVQAAGNGLVIASVNNLTYVSYDGDATNFVLRSYDDSVGMIPATDVKRIEFAIAPSDENIVYASVVNQFREIYNVYQSTNKGETWEVVMPGTESMVVLGGQGVYNNTIKVFPQDANKILLGGINLWLGEKIQETGYFAWKTISQGFIPDQIQNYLHVDQHVYTFRPGSNNQFLVGTDGGVYIGNFNSDFTTYEPGNRNYNTTQFYSVGLSGVEHYVIGGSQDNGSILITGKGNTAQQGNEIMGGDLGFQNGGDGGPAVISIINKDVLVASTTYGDVKRSDDGGKNYSTNGQFLDGIGNINSFKTPLALWESFDNPNSRDSIMFYNRTYETIANGDEVMAESANSKQPFYFISPKEMIPGDSVKIVDPVSSRFFLATANNIYMINSLHNFAKTPEWWKIADKDFTVFGGFPQCLAFSADANHLFVGTQSGELFRISNLALAYNFERADVSSPSCIVSVEKLPVYIPGTTEEISQVLTSIAVDPQDASRIIVTFGNYGNDQYVMYSDNALDQVPTFESKQGNLPLMPVYSSLIEMKDGNIAIIGTEYGIFTTSNISASSPNWEKDDQMMGSVPVFELKQQLIGKEKMTVQDGTDEKVFDGATNKGLIYAATYGRGLFYTTRFWQPTTDIKEIVDSGNKLPELKLYPNPAFETFNLEVEVATNATAIVSVYDLGGKLVKNQQQMITKGSSTISINISDLNTGTYFVKTTVGAVVYSNKLMVN